MGNQTLVIRMPESTARRIRAVLEAPGAGYESINEFMLVAVENQLSAEAPSPGTLSLSAEAAHSATLKPREQNAEPYASVGASIDQMRPVVHFKAPPTQSPLPLAEPPDVNDQRLFSLTNRLSQLKVSVRVCAQLALRGAWPDIREFQQKAAATARAIGIVLRGQESESSRLSVGYPTGDDAEKAQARFVNSFTIGNLGNRKGGPLAILGLANVVEGKVALTEKGWEFAVLPSALTREAESGVLLSPAEAQLLREQLRKATAECDAIVEFIRDVHRANGMQSRIDQKLNEDHPDWNTQQVIAHRAAMVGRLGDVDVVSVEGRGSSALIHLLPAAQDFMN